MKQPRITDFDPNAPAPPLGSPLDGLPRIQTPPAPRDRPSAESRLNEETPQEPVDRQIFPDPASGAPSAPRHDSLTAIPAVRPVRPVPLVPPGRVVPPSPAKRRPIKQRHPFDIYEDQLESLRALALEERKQGGVGSMSAMVRSALDTFILKKKRSS